ncbi:hypothetical protein Trydic_g12819 [Trypoxylus dichotomus]
MFSFHIIFGLIALRCGIEASPPTSSAAEKDDGLLWKALRVSQALLGTCAKEFSSSAFVSSSIDLSRADYSNVSELMSGCLLRRSALALDRLRTIDHLQICRGVDLVRYRNDSETIGSGSSHLRRSYTDKVGVDRWKDVIDKLDLLLETRILKIQMTTDETPLAEEGRRRHHYHQMYPIILFGTLAVTMIAIPMGFQFLAVLGGKALLLAKLALILTSIQGLKKIATSNLNYGLYHTAPVNPWHYDRSWYYNSKDDHLQGYQEHDGQEPAADLFHPLLSPRNEKIK